MDKKISHSLLMAILIMILCLPVASRATLINNLDGTVTQARDDLTYGDGSVLMWLKDPNNNDMTWWDAMDWITSLNASIYLGYSDWRLPLTLPVNGTSYNYTYSYDGSTDVGYNIKSPNSEMAYMFYVEMGNLGYCNTSGSCPQTGWGLSNTGLFSNLQPFNYWSGSSANSKWFFDFEHGYQNAIDEDELFYAWAVHTVPEPGTFILMGSGLTGMALILNRLKNRKP